MDTRLACLVLVAFLSPGVSELYNVIPSQEFDFHKASKEVVAISFVRSKPYDEVFQDHYRQAGEYLHNFGVLLCTVDCVSDPVSEYCHKAEAADNIFIFRHGTNILTLPYDTLFGEDAIVSNILHLVLLYEVPIASDDVGLTDILEKHRGKRDVIFGYVPAIGTRADRAFIEIAFAYKHKHEFVVTTMRDLIEGANEIKQSVSRSPDPVLAILQCSQVGRGEACPQVRYHGPVTTESLALMMKVLEQPAVVDVTEKEQIIPYTEHGLSALYAVTDPANHKQALSVIMEIKDTFQGSLGFVVINRDNVADVDLLPAPGVRCIPACYVLRGYDEDLFSNNIRDVSDLRTFLHTNIHKVFDHLGNNQAEHDYDDGFDGQDESNEGDIPAQERQDDHVQEATVHLRNALDLKEPSIPSLTDITFPEFTSQSRLTTVLFMMKWNPRCLAFLQSFESAGQHITALLPGESELNPLARVECSDWPDVCDKNNVTVYPTVKMYKSQSDIATYGGILHEDNFLRSYMLYHLPHPLELGGMDDYNAFTEGSFPGQWVRNYLPAVTVAIISDEFNKEKSIYQQVAKELRGEYMLGLCSSACARDVQDSSDKGDFPSVTLYKWSDAYKPQETFTEDFTLERLTAFIRGASLPMLPELTPASMPTYLARRKPFVILFHAGDSASTETAQTLVEIAADKSYSHFIMCQMDSSEEQSIGSKTLTRYGFLPSPDQPPLVILDHGAGEVCRAPQGMDGSGVKAWLQAAVDGHKECSESRSLIDREWKPLVPPYDYLKLMEDEEHNVGHGRRGLGVTPTDEDQGVDERREERPQDVDERQEEHPQEVDEEGEEDEQEELRVKRKLQSTKHVEL